MTPRDPVSAGPGALAVGGEARAHTHPPIAVAADELVSRLDRLASIGLNPAASEGIHVRP